MPIINTSSLTKIYEKNIVAVDTLNLSINEGEIFGLLGPNGAGKSTAIKMLCGIINPTSGDGDVMGFSLSREREKIKEKIGYMSQKFGLYNDLTVYENMRFYANIYSTSRNEAKDNVSFVMEKFGFEQYRSTKAEKLSGGWKQRLALCCSIVHRPKLLFLDEPTAGVDPVSRRTMWDYLYKLNSIGTTLFVTTHYMEEAERCTRIGFINNGKLLACDSPDKLKAGTLPYKIFAVKTKSLSRAFEVLKHIADIEDSNIYGDSIHIVTGSPEKVLPAIGAELKSSGIELEGIDEIAPSIEDIFVYLSK
ncbi:MAG: ABC transporter ATP-binding protein [Candidatus Schekmanbacteria bacterium]|nr:ABC transporter ATP-binding protein [Candidatus Schekmanbacteria bacterium]